VTDQPLVSIFTPTHNPRYLADLWSSIAAQTYENWEWVVVLNNDARLSNHLRSELDADERVRFVDAGVHSGGIGLLKNMACREAHGDLLLEVDHDDLLMPEAVAKTVSAFASNPDAALVYSDTAQINADGSANYDEWIKINGWEYETVHLDPPMLIGGNSYSALYRTISFEPTPHNVSLIWFAPNHVRAFRAEAYRQAGEYNTMQPHNDDQDLMCRLYQVGDFVHIPEVLYLQRMHEANTQRDPQINANIQILNWELYERYVQDNALAWSRRKGLASLDLGCGNSLTPGYTGIDLVAEGENVTKHDLGTGIPYDDNSVGVVRCMDFLGYVEDQQFLLDEIHRVLAAGGLLLSLTPSSDGRGAFQDPASVSYWNQNSFWYYTDRRYRHEDRQRGRGSAAFQPSRVRTFFPSPFHEQHQISYVQANLIAVKPGMPRNGGELFI